MFVVPDMERKEWVRLQAQLRKLFARIPLRPSDSLFVVPLRDEHVAEIEAYGQGTLLVALQERPLKIIL